MVTLWGPVLAMTFRGRSRPFRGESRTPRSPAPTPGYRAAIPTAVCYDQGCSDDRRQRERVPRAATPIPADRDGPRWSPASTATPRCGPVPAPRSNAPTMPGWRSPWPPDAARPGPPLRTGPAAQRPADHLQRRDRGGGRERADDLPGGGARSADRARAALPARARPLHLLLHRGAYLRARASGQRSGRWYRPASRSRSWSRLWSGLIAGTTLPEAGRRGRPGPDEADPTPGRARSWGRLYVTQTASRAAGVPHPAVSKGAALSSQVAPWTLASPRRR